MVKYRRIILEFGNYHLGVAQEARVKVNAKLWHGIACDLKIVSLRVEGLADSLERNWATNQQFVPLTMSSKRGARLRTM